MAGEDCSAGFAIFPIIMIVFFLSILSRALRGAGGFSGGYSSGYRSNRRPGVFYALQYLDNRGGSGYGGYNSYYGSGSAAPYTTSRYSSYPSSQPAYAEQPPPGINPSYGTTCGPAYGTPGFTGYQQPPPPAYQSGPAGYRPAYSTGNVPGPAYPSPGLQNYPSISQAPAPEVPKVSCSYCGSLNPAAERNCLLCGAPMK